eukprot:8293896-Pyramimonas_sp.AAC.1
MNAGRHFVSEQPLGSDFTNSTTGSTLPTITRWCGPRLTSAWRAREDVGQDYRSRSPPSSGQRTSA